MTANTNDPVTRIVVEDPLGRKHNLTGAHALTERGTAGVTPIDWVGPGWSHYVMLLRRRGLDIETVNESHGGAYAGRHGRYVLRTPVTVLSVTRASSGEKVRRA